MGKFCVVDSKDWPVDFSFSSFFFCVDVSCITFASHYDLSETTKKVFDVKILSVHFFPIFAYGRSCKFEKLF